MKKFLFLSLFLGMGLASIVSIAVVRSQEQQGTSLADFSVANFQAATQAGNVSIPEGPTLVWEAGDHPADILRVGHLSDLGTPQLTLTQIGQAQGFDPSQVVLSQFETIQHQTIGSLARAIPSLKQLTVGEVPPIRDLIRTKVDQTIGSVLDRYGNLPLANLEQYTVGNIPGLADVKLGRLAQFERTRISGVPGLESLPFNQFPSPFGAAIWANVDTIYGPKETDRTRTITGGLHANGGQPQWNIPCQKDCSYVELEDYGGDLEILHGLQFISGQQQVSGGWGVLKWVNGGKEPTGRHPFGKVFKVGIDDLVEAQGQGTLFLYFRYCQHAPLTGKKIGCTPYFLPVALQQFHETDLIPVGQQGLTANQVRAFQDHVPQGGAVLQAPPIALDPQLPLGGTENPVELPAAAPTPFEATETCPPPGPPTLNRFTITSPYGKRRKPCPTCSDFHRGTDLGTPYQTGVMAIQDGVVIASDVHPFNGLYTAVEGCDGYTTFYLHLDQARVQVGQQVRQGQVLGLSGGGPPSPKAHRGASTGNHLHIGVKQTDGGFVNPQSYIGL